MKIKVLTYIVAISAFSLVSCDDFLDKVPDNRTELKTPEQMSLLLVDGYSKANIGLMCELSGDNFVDNNSPDEAGNRYNLKSYERIDDEIWRWDDAKSYDQEDSPTAVWEGGYHAIAVANHVLERVKFFESEGRGDEVKAQKGEALVIRAYNHFVLVSMFAPQYRGENLSKADQGIPYVTEPERTVMVNYERISVADVYKKIEDDLKEGLPLIDDTKYDVPKYRFNKKAANAFAARFYLNKRQYDLVEKYATEALGGTGGNPMSFMRTIWSVDYSTYESLVYGYIDANSSSNLMCVATESAFLRRYNDGYRYAVNREAAKATIYGPGPTWKNYNFHPCYSGRLYVNKNQEYGVYFPKDGELFEYTDKVAGIGNAHVVRCEFTGEETILCRAEARLFLGNIDGAVADLRVWDEARQKVSIVASFATLTRELIESYYGGAKDPGYGIVKPLNTDKVFPSDQYFVTPEIEPYLQCVLHYRRIETIFDGYRWFDIKRHGIEITHKIGKDKVDVLKWDDPRRAFQIPAEVIAAGMAPTDRKLLPVSNEKHIRLNVKLTQVKDK